MGLQGTVLDIGAGDRWLSQHLPDCVDYIALDYPPTGRDLYRARPDVFADAARLPIADQAALGRLWPDWGGMATGYSLEAVKP